VGATYKVEAKPSDPALGFGAEAEPFANPVLTLCFNTWLSMPVRVEHPSCRGEVTQPRIRAMRPRLSLPDPSCDISMRFSTEIVIHVESGMYASSYSKYQVSIEAMVECGDERCGQEMFVTYHITRHNPCWTTK
jgi:hypothetical protein